ncbi:MAG: DUF1684 domain-containing protein [Bacteroidota bacterium]
MLAGADHEQQVAQWHSERINNLKKEHGWLSLIALDWLNEGRNTVPLIGTVEIKKGAALLTLKKGTAGLIGGKKFISGTVVPDKDKVVIGTKAVQVIARGGKFAVRVWDSESPGRKNFSGIERFPVSDKWMITARWESYAKSKTIEIPTVIPGLVQKGIVPGAAVFTIDGKEYRLEPTIEDGEEQLFFVFGDKTNGRESYGAGRFLYAGPPSDGKIVLDFNRSYNPPCAFTDFATCPVPSPGNKLPVRIEAGEKKMPHH